MTTIKARRLTVFLAIGLSVLTLLPQSVAEAKVDDEITVKVGYYYSKNFQEGTSDDEMKTGYAYEYLQKISDYTGWNYDYVYGGWTDLLDKLEKGEIDVMCGVSYTEERAEHISYPDFEMGQEHYYLYQHDYNILNENDPDSFKGAIIGAIYNNVMTDCLENWIEENGIDVQIRYYSNLEDRDNQFESGAIDAFVATDSNVVVDTTIQPVAKVGSESYYLAVTKERTDLLRQLNTAIDLIHNINPYYIDNLQYTNYDNTVRIANLTDQEQTWVDSHDELRIGYLRNYLPYCDVDNEGNVTGLIVDVMDAIIEKFKLQSSIKVVYKDYENYQDLIDAVIAGEIDAIFPTGGNHWYIEQDGLDATVSVVNASIDLAYKGAYNENSTRSIAVNRNNKIQYYYTVSHYPNAVIKYYNSLPDSLDAINRGEVDSTIVNGLRIDTILKNASYSDIAVVQLEESDSFCIGVKSGNFGLLILLDHGINAIGQDYGLSASYNYLDGLNHYTLQDIIRMNYGLVIAMICLVAAVIVMLLGTIIYRLKKSAEEREQYMSEIEQAHRDTLRARMESNTDEMTQFYNRRSFEKACAELEEKGLPEDLAIISMDINGLKNANDNLGHKAGDEIIIGASDCISKCFNKYGRCFRVGGDEFMVLMNGTDEEMHNCIDSLKDTVASWSGELVKELSLSCGYTSVRENPKKTIKDLEKIADKRMYEEKSLYYSNRRDRRTNQRDALVNIFNSYIKVLKIDLSSNTYQIIKVEQDEIKEETGFASDILIWLRNFATSGGVHADDLDYYLEKTSPSFLRNYFKDNDKPLQIFYHRWVNTEYRYVMMEIIPSDEYSDADQTLYLYVKEINL